jgi:hypothetical protein
MLDLLTATIAPRPSKQTHADLIREARRAEQRASVELQFAALQRVDGVISQDELDGFACRYHAAVLERRLLEAQRLDRMPDLRYSEAR